MFLDIPQFILKNIILFNLLNFIFRIYIDFQNDYVCLGKTNNDLANQIDYLKNENVRNDLGKKLKNEVLKNYNANIEIKKVIKLYNELM